MHISRRRLIVICLAAMTLLLLASCGDSGSSAANDGGTGSSSTTSTTTAKPGTATIDKLDAPTSVQCTGTSSTTIDISWATTGAAKNLLRVDGRDVPEATAASGTVTAPVHCDALPHTVALIAYDKNNAPTSKVVYTNTVLPTSTS